MLGAVSREMTEGSSIEFIWYWMPQHEINGHTVLFIRHQSMEVFRLFDILIGCLDISI